MRDERLEVSVTFDPARGYVASAPELRAPVTALSLGGLRRSITTSRSCCTLIAPRGSSATSAGCCRAELALCNIRFEALCSGPRNPALGEFAMTGLD